MASAELVLLPNGWKMDLSTIEVLLLPNDTKKLNFDVLDKIAHKLNKVNKYQKTYLCTRCKHRFFGSGLQFMDDNGDNELCNNCDIELQDETSSDED